MPINFYKNIVPFLCLVFFFFSNETSAQHAQRLIKKASGLKIGVGGLSHVPIKHDLVLPNSSTLTQVESNVQNYLSPIIFAGWFGERRVSRKIDFRYGLDLLYVNGKYRRERVSSFLDRNQETWRMADVFHFNTIYFSAPMKFVFNIDTESRNSYLTFNTDFRFLFPGWSWSSFRRESSEQNFGTPGNPIWMDITNGSINEGSINMENLNIGVGLGYGRRFKWSDKRDVSMEFDVTYQLFKSSIGLDSHELNAAITCYYYFRKAH